MSYTKAVAHDEGSNQFFYMDLHHYGVSFLPDDIILKASNNLVSEGDSETDCKEPAHAQSSVYLNRVP